MIVSLCARESSLQNISECDDAGAEVWKSGQCIKKKKKMSEDNFKLNYKIVFFSENKTC